MARPVGVTAKVKDNSRKKFRKHDEWMEGKKIGRPKQRWVWDVEPCSDGVSKYNGPGIGHWEKV
jgi:hypothetical protein